MSKPPPEHDNASHGSATTAPPAAAGPPRRGLRLAVVNADMAPAPGPGLLRDPVCGMMVRADAPLRAAHEGQTYVFCNPRCRERFQASPSSFLKAGYTPSHHPPGDMAAPAGAGRVYVCPMDPEVRAAGPGACPKCGMALEPELGDLMDAAGHDGTGSDPELGAMVRRFIVVVALTIPLVAIAMAHMLPYSWAHRLQHHPARVWVELALALPVVTWGAAPFFARAWS